MADFDPDAYLATPRTPKREPRTQPFDPDAYLSRPLTGAQQDPSAAPAAELPVAQRAREAARYAGEAAEGLTRGVEQGATLGFDDEVAGLAAATGGTLGRYADAAQDYAGLGRMPRLEELGPLLRSMRDQGINDYREARDSRRGEAQRIRQAAPNATLAGELGGGLLPGLLTAGASLPAQGAGLLSKVGAGSLAGGSLGYLSGLGNSSGDMTRGSPIDVAQLATDGLTGAAIGGGFGALAPALGAGAQKLLNKGLELRSAAQDRAQALAREAELKILNSARGALGGATQGLNRTIENIERINLTEAAPTGAQLAEGLRRSAQAAREQADNLIQGALGRGVTEGAEASGEWLSAGSRLDRAQKAAQQARLLTDGAARAESQAAQLAALGEQRLPNSSSVEALEHARSLLRQSPEWAGGNQALLASQLDEFSAEVTRAQAARQAFEAAAEGFEPAVATRAERLIGAPAAVDWAKRVGLRYGPPLVGTALGSAAGGTAGALAGLAGGGGLSALAGLAGAGARPAIQSIRRGVTQHPAVMDATGRLLQMAAPAAGLASVPAGLGVQSAQRAVTADQQAQDRYEMLRRALEGG